MVEIPNCVDIYHGYVAPTVAQVLDSYRCMVFVCRSQGFDAAAWLKRQCWDVCEEGAAHKTFERKYVGAKPKSKAATAKPKAKGSA